MAKNKKTKNNVAEIESAATETVTEVKENKSDDNVMISHVELPIDVATATTISIDTKKEEVKKAKPIERETKQPVQNIKKIKPRIDFNYFWNGTYIG